MRKWLSLFILGVLLAIPSLAVAQSAVHLATLDVKFWPEYDNPGVLVIYDFTLPADAVLPVNVTFSIPAGVTVHAVAALENGGLFEVPYDGPTAAGDAQTLTLTVDKQTSYHFEYYAPIHKSGDKRQLSFVWAGEYAVDKLSVSVQQPPSATDFVGTPALKEVKETDGLTYHTAQVDGLKAGEPFNLNVEYNKSTDVLTAPTPSVQPAYPLDQNTAGRVSLGNYAPYLVGGLGILLVAGGLGYYFLWGRRESSQPSRRRRRAPSSQESGAGADVYCPQCGQRGRGGDRFCRVCGTRFRPES